MHVQGPPVEVEISEFDPRPGCLFELLHDSGSRPAVRDSAPDDVDERERKEDRHSDHQGHSMFQAKFSRLFAHHYTLELLRAIE